jgi:hypothetical protein
MSEEDLVTRLRAFCDDLMKYQDTYEKECATIEESIEYIQELQRENAKLRGSLIALGFSIDRVNPPSHSHLRRTTINPDTPDE